MKMMFGWKPNGGRGAMGGRSMMGVLLAVALGGAVKVYPDESRTASKVLRNVFLPGVPWTSHAKYACEGGTDQSVVHACTQFLEASTRGVARCLADVKLCLG